MVSFYLQPLLDSISPIVFPGITEGYLCGNAAINNIILPHNSVSRIHCNFQVSPRSLSVVDLKSANGTYINGNRIKPLIPRNIAEGDIIGIASNKTENVDTDKPFVYRLKIHILNDNEHDWKRKFDSGLHPGEEKKARIEINTNLQPEIDVKDDDNDVCVIVEIPKEDDENLMGNSADKKKMKAPIRNQRKEIAQQSAQEMEIDDNYKRFEQNKKNAEERNEKNVNKNPKENTKPIAANQSGSLDKKTIIQPIASDSLKSDAIDKDVTVKNFKENIKPDAPNQSGTLDKKTIIQSIASTSLKSDATDKNDNIKNFKENDKPKSSNQSGTLDKKTIIQSVASTSLQSDATDKNDVIKNDKPKLSNHKCTSDKKNIIKRNNKPNASYQSGILDKKITIQSIASNSLKSDVIDMEDVIKNFKENDKQNAANQSGVLDMGNIKPIASTSFKYDTDDKQFSNSPKISRKNTEPKSKDKILGIGQRSHAITKPPTYKKITSNECRENDPEYLRNKIADWNKYVERKRKEWKIYLNAKLRSIPESKRNTLESILLRPTTKNSQPLVLPHIISNKNLEHQSKDKNILSGNASIALLNLQLLSFDKNRKSVQQDKSNKIIKAESKHPTFEKQASRQSKIGPVLSAAAASILADTGIEKNSLGKFTTDHSRSLSINERSPINRQDKNNHVNEQQKVASIGKHNDSTIGALAIVYDLTNSRSDLPKSAFKAAGFSKPIKKVKFSNNLPTKSTAQEVSMPSTSYDNGLSIQIQNNVKSTPKKPELTNHSLKLPLDFLEFILKWDPQWLDSKEFSQEIRIQLPFRSGNTAHQKMEMHLRPSFINYYSMMSTLILHEMWTCIIKAKRKPSIYGVINYESTTITLYDYIDYSLTEFDIDIEQVENVDSGDLVILALTLSDGKSKLPIFAYIKDCKKKVLTQTAHKGLEDVVLVTYTLVTKRLPPNIVCDERYKLQCVYNISIFVHMIQAVKSLQSSPLFPIINPTVEEEIFSLPKIPIYKSYKFLTDNKLDEKQMETIVRITNAIVGGSPKVCLIDGPPGTGKSHVIVNLVTEIMGSYKRCQKKERILICTRSNAAIDSITEKLIDIRNELKAASPLKECPFKIVRIGSAKSLTHESVKEVLVSKLMRDTNKSFADIVNEADIIACTLSSCWAYRMESTFARGLEKVNVCIIDDAMMSWEPESLLPLMIGVKQLVLVGDSNQLPISIASNEVKEFNHHKSLFSRLHEKFELNKNNPIITLDNQYRTAKEIIDWPNKFFYNNKLHTNVSIPQKWPFQEYGVFGHDSEETLKFSCNSYINRGEANFVSNLIYTMIIRSGLDELDNKIRIGVVTPYYHQKELIDDLLTESINGEKIPVDVKNKIVINVNTTDCFQGQEYDIIIMSCVRSSKLGLLYDQQRLCRTLTRAKYSLFICGNFKFIKTDDDATWRNLLEDAHNRGFYKHVNYEMTTRDMKDSKIVMKN
ncbi:uncharacterized protein LOC130663330 isoform X2 [Microplitis mediator]|uniref:uncharacterized protein LOC130663330 isoform X2 n=1 Tax=Microplitis mediator TaxID=375433 RepID=UPI0025529E36|nr:uncharacterized protein LOC130663330 isoform X2 [Microplitis mediator]